MTEEQEPHFRPLGGEETTEDAEAEGHDLGTQSSAGEPEEAIGSTENVSTEELEDFQHGGFDRGA